MKGERELNRLYGDVSREITSLLLDVNLDTFNGNQAEAIGARIRRMVRTLNEDVYEWADTYLREAYRKGAGKARTALEILGRKPKGLPRGTDAAFVEDTTELVMRRNNTINGTAQRYLSLVTLASSELKSVQIQEWSASEESIKIGGLAERAVIEQKSRGWLTKQLITSITGLVSDGDLIDINGRMWNLNTYSKMLSRTTLRTAQSRATEDLCDQYENDLVEISDHGTGCESEICQPYEGKVFSINGKTPGYEILNRWPPFHPECQHSSLPTSEEAMMAAGRPLGSGGRGMDPVPDRGHFKDPPMYDETLQMIKDDYAARGITISTEYAERIMDDVGAFVTADYESMRWAQLGLTSDGRSFREVKGLRSYLKYKDSANRLDSYIKTAPSFPADKPIFRGFRITPENRKFLQTLQDAKIGSTIELDVTTHWSSHLTQARRFDGTERGDLGGGIVFRTKGARDSTSVKHMSAFQGEDEVAVASGQKFRIVAKEVDANDRLLIDLEPVN